MLTICVRSGPCSMTLSFWTTTHWPAEACKFATRLPAGVPTLVLVSLTLYRPPHFNILANLAPERIRTGNFHPILDAENRGRRSNRASPALFDNHEWVDEFDSALLEITDVTSGDGE